MPYKDAEKQREANRIAAAKRRQGMTQGITISKGMTDTSKLEGMTGMTKGMTQDKGMTSHPKSAEELLNSVSSVFATAQGRKKLNNIIEAFHSSNHPEQMREVRLGIFGPTLAEIDNL